MLKGIEKLDDANMAGTNESHRCTLILTEGDSAKALAVSGLSVIGRNLYGIFPLRGKLLNVRDICRERATKNKEVSSLMKILGLSFMTKKQMTSSKEEKIELFKKGLRYGRILIFTDQDVDGFTY